MTDDTPSERPAWSRPPFEPGNTLAMRHGAHSEAVVSAKAAELLEDLRAEFPWLVDADEGTIDVYCKARARLDILDEYAWGIITGEVKAFPRKGVPSSGPEAVPERIWQQLSRESRTVLDAAARLGFDPVGRAQLVRDLRIGMHYSDGRFVVNGAARVAERGRAIREARGRGDEADQEGAVVITNAAAVIDAAALVERSITNDTDDVLRLTDEVLLGGSAREVLVELAGIAALYAISAAAFSGLHIEDARAGLAEMVADEIRSDEEDER